MQIIARRAHRPRARACGIASARAAAAAREDRGAALIIAIGVLTLLLVIAVTFFRASRQEVQTADNVVNSVRAEILADGATSVAIAFLNHDLRAHPSYTSLDHAWRTYFNGSWFVGKPELWALSQGTILVPPLNHPAVNNGAPGIPEINPAVMPPARLGDDLYIPRYVGPGDLDVPPANYTSTANPFVTSLDLGDWPIGNAAAFAPRLPLADNVFYDFQAGAFPLILRGPDGDATNDRLPAEQIHFWTDIDNDGDGLRDSMWLPVGSDVVFTRDGIDNNLNGVIDEQGETAVFLYYGGNDGLDNDRDGVIDDSNEQRLYLTTPIVNPEDGQPLLNANAIQGDAINVGRLGEWLPEGVDVNDVLANDVRIDVLDNNYDLLVNGGQTFLVNPNLETNSNRFALGLTHIHPRYVGIPLTGGFQVRSTGETVTELTGRMAILIKDTASKVNINTAGGYSYDLDKAADDPDAPLTHAFNEGVGPHEYDVRVLPFEISPASADSLGKATADKLWDFRMGAPRGRGLKSDPSIGFQIFQNASIGPQETIDMSLPGYGFVDDDGNVVASLLDGIDNDGNGFIDDGLFAYDYDNDTSTPPVISASFEGIDDPQEWQRFRPLRNEIAEQDGTDNDEDDIRDEIGELGDRFYRTGQQITAVHDIGPVALNTMRNSITVHSIDRNDRYAHKNVDDAGPPDTPAQYRTAWTRDAIGARKNLNVARPNDVARAVRRGWPYPVSQPSIRADQITTVSAAATTGEELVVTRNDFPGSNDVADPRFALDFLRGLRQENVTVFTSQDILGLPSPGWYADVVNDGNAFSLLADSRLRAHQVAANVKDYADRDYTRSVDEIFEADPWWRNLAVNGGANAALQQIARTQQIYYTTAGQESIRINEIMVRPVRRVEAEVTTWQDAPPPSDPANPVESNLYAVELDPNRFVQRFALNGNPLGPVGLEKQGFRMRVRTTTDAFAAFQNDSAQQPPAPRPRTYTIDTDDPEAQRWQRSEAFFNGSFLGLGSVWRTYRAYLDVNVTEGGPGGSLVDSFRVPDVVQFSFHPTDELPAGRYYVTVSTQFVDEDAGALRNSVNKESDFNFAVKIAPRNQDIFTDIVNIGALARGQGVYTNAWRAPAMLGSDAVGGSAGMAFLQGDAVFRSTLTSGVAAGSVYSSQDDFGANNRRMPNLGFTIEVPPRDQNNLTNIDEENWLHIALRSRKPDGQGFVINFFEFSQEPDHEWVEVANLDKENAVDLSGWQLAVENHPLGLGPFTIPPNTVIAPGGMLLLGANKFDFGYDVQPSEFAFRGRGFYTNGIGLVQTNELVMPEFSFVTIPITFFNPQAIGQGSVFRGIVQGTVLRDFVDNDGDGIFDDGYPNRPDDLIISTDGPLENAIDTLPRPSGNPGTSPFDRIVELQIPDFVPAGGRRFEVGDIARVVLGGGLFPNRPEWDFVDNDADGGELFADGIDNDADGVIDEAGEGRDEGRFPRFARMFNDVTPVPGSYHDVSVPYTTVFADFGPLGADGLPPYLDKTLNPPEWMEFIEERNFPGDNVIVTLYEGPARDNQVVDRATYNQRDVDNRAVDDIVLTTDFDLLDDGVGELSVTATFPQPLDQRFPALWPENTMGIDFARSLERKHPAYTGDRHGTRNRFQATDGNYDDWADATSRWERVQEFDGGGGLTGTQLFDRFRAAADVYARFAHAVRGTPLRRNTPASFAEEASDPRANMFELATFRNAPLVSPADILGMPHTSKRQRFQTAFLANGFGGEDVGYIVNRASHNASFAPFNNPTRADFTYDKILVGQRFDDQSAPINYFRDRRAFIGDAGTTDAAVLTVGQADVYTVTDAADPAWITTAGVTRVFAPEKWSPIMLMPIQGETKPGPDPPGFEVPDRDVPQFTSLVFQGLFDVNRFLFARSPAIPDSVTPDRWPLERRAVIYASRNFDGFNPNEPVRAGAGAEALFVWDGDDGLENGEYDVYLVTAENLDRLLNSPLLLQGEPSDPTDAGITNFGIRFLATTDLSAAKDLLVDVEVFTDRDGDRKVWTDFDADGFPDNAPGASELNRGQGLQPTESFGVQEGLQPDASGVVHYGVVRVENNHLAILLRNWADSGETNRFSRVLLAARNKTPGRININTVESRRIKNDLPDPQDFNADQNFFNALQGLPGILQRPDDDDNVAFDETAADGRRLFFTENNEIVHPQALIRHILEQKQRTANEHPDGRYYELTADLLSDDHTPLIDTNGDNNPDFARPPLVRNDANLITISGTDADRSAALLESAQRLRRMQNLITTRSDVFEIFVTVQIGYGTDENGDGRINWRDDNEFTVTAEETSRTVYER